MLDTERIRLMTGIAVQEKRDHRKLEIAEEYTKKDYISMRILRSFLLGTIFYLILYALVTLGVFYRFFTAIHLSNLLVALFLGLIVYIVFLFFFLRASAKRAQAAYRQASRARKEFEAKERELMRKYQE